ncbi:hypothetical protein JKG47_07560 [Acidithiobacillus sp. MC6.1]|nr:hypothetical protein [Acidithiobacillus sp. MC6.1]
MRKYPNHNARPVYSAVALTLLLAWTSPGWATTQCPSSEAATAAAAKQALAQEAVEKPAPNNPAVQAIRGPQCVNQAGNYSAMLQQLNALPISGAGSQILQIIEMLFSTTQNNCSTNALPPSSTSAGTNPVLNVVTPPPLAATPYSSGPGSSSNLYQSLFP